MKMLADDGSDHQEAKLPRKIGDYVGCLFFWAFCLIPVGMLVAAAIAFAQEKLPEAIAAAIASLVWAVIVSGVVGCYRHFNRAAKQERARRELNQDEPWLRREDWASGRITYNDKAKVVAIWVLVVPISAMIIGLVVSLPGLWSESKARAVFFGIAFPPVGIGLLYWAIRFTIRWHRYGVSKFEMAAVPGVIGGRLAGVIRTNAKLVPEDAIHLKLSCINRTWRRDSENKQRINESTRWESKQKLTRELAESDSSRSVIPVVFDIPYSCEPTDSDHSNRELLWRLEVNARVPGADYAASFEVPVFKTSESSLDGKSGPDLLAAYRGQEQSLGEGKDHIAAAKIEVLPLASGGQELVFRSARHLLPVAMGFFGSLFYGAMLWAMAEQMIEQRDEPSLGLALFGCFFLLLCYLGSFVLLGTMNTFLLTVRVVASPGALSIRREYLGFGKTKVFATSDIKELTVDHFWGHANVWAQLKSGKKVLVGAVVKGEKTGRWLRDEVARTLYRRKT